MFVPCSPLFFEEDGLRRGKASIEELKTDDPRVRRVPFFFARPNRTEMERVYHELVTVRVEDRNGSEPTEDKEKAVQEPAGISEQSDKAAEETPSQSSLNPESQSEASPANPSLPEKSPAEVIFWKAVEDVDLPAVAEQLVLYPHFVLLW